MTNTRQEREETAMWHVLWALVLVMLWGTSVEAAVPVTLQNAAAATGNGTVMTVSDKGTVGLTVKDTFMGTVTFEGSADGTVTWDSVRCTKLGTTTVSTTTTAIGQFQCDVSGLSHFRARVSAFTSGTITVIGQSTVAGGASGGGSVAVGDVTNAGTFVVQEDGAALAALQLIDNIVIAEDSAHTNLEGLAKVGCVQQATTANLAGTDLDWQPITCKDGALSVHIATSAVGDDPNPEGHVQVQPVAGSVGGATTLSFISAGATEDEHAVCTAACTLYSITATNTNAAVRYLKCENDTAANTAPGTDTPELRLAVPGAATGAGITTTFPVGAAFSTALTCWLVTGAADNDVAEVAASELIVFYTFLQ